MSHSKCGIEERQWVAAKATYFITVLVCVWMFYLCKYKCTPFAQCLQKPWKSSGSPEAGFTRGCEWPSECWELKLGLLLLKRATSVLNHQPMFPTPTELHSNERSCLYFLSWRLTMFHNSVDTIEKLTSGKYNNDLSELSFLCWNVLIFWIRRIK